MKLSETQLLHPKFKDLNIVHAFTFCSSKMLVSTFRTTQYDNPEDHKLVVESIYFLVNRVYYQMLYIAGSQPRT